MYYHLCMQMHERERGGSRDRESEKASDRETKRGSKERGRLERQRGGGRVFAFGIKRQCERAERGGLRERESERGGVFWL